MKRYILAIVLLAVNFMQAQKSTYSCSISNMAQVSANRMVFDLWLEWKDGTTEFHGIQVGIDFDYAAIANNGVLTVAMVPGSSSLKAAQLSNAGIRIDKASGQLRITSLGVGNVLPAPNHKFRVGTFMITNTVSFSENSEPRFSWYTGSTDTAHSRNVVLAAGKPGRLFVATNLDNHSVENPDFRLNPSALASSFMSYQIGDSVYFYIGSTVSGIATVQFYDLAGRLVKDVSQSVDDSGAFAVNVDLRNGLYIAKVRLNNADYSSKLLIK